MAQRLVVLSIPSLSRRDVTPGALSCLEALAGRGSVVEVEPAFPGLASSCFATLITGVEAVEHGIIGDAYFDRGARRVVRPPADADHAAPRLWDRLASARPGVRCLLVDPPASAGAGVDLCLSRGSGGLPAELAASIARRLGPRPESPAEAAAWSLRAAGQAIRERSPDLALVRVPRLGQVARRHGPDGRESARALTALDPLLAEFLDGLPPGTAAIAVTESIATPVSGPIYPNRILRELGLLRLADGPAGLDVDLTASPAFALADQQLCHVYLNDTFQAAIVASAFCDVFSDGIARVASGRQRARLGLDHPHAGDVVLVSESDRYFAPDWWERPAEAPRPGPDGSGLVAPGAGDPIRGAQGAPMPCAEYCGVAVSDRPLPPAGRRLTAAGLGASLFELLR